MANFPGTAGNDNLLGTADADTFNISLGGTDAVTGADGDDVIVAGAAFDALDQINGGQGHDRLELLGDYSGGITFTISTLKNVEEIKLGAGFSYELKTHESAVANGASLKFDAYSVGAGKTVHINGSGETNGSFLFYDGQSDDTFIGGEQSDSFSLAYNGNDRVYGNGGGDVVTCEATFDAGDMIDGGDGNDVVYLRGASYNGFTITGAMLKNVETLGLAGNFNYGITAANNLVKAGQNLYVTAEGLSGAGRASFNGSAENDGTFSFRDGINDDNFSGGQLGDVFLNAGGGSDIFQGQGGDDTFYMYGNLDFADTVLGGTGRDGVILSGDYSGGVTFDMFTLSGIEYLSTYDGFDYMIKTDDATVGPNKTFDVYASYLSAAHHIVFDGSAETDGSFNFYDGFGDDTFVGGAGKDYLDAHNGGNDSFYGGAGNDHVSFFDAYTTEDFYDGGTGSDSVYLYGDFAGGLTLGSDQFMNVESITLGPGHSYNVTTLDSLVASGKSIAFDTYWSEAGENFVFDGSAETDGWFRLTGGNGDDVSPAGGSSE